LKVGANLTWGPCFDYQKQFFCGTVDKVSQYPYLLRYDIEVSGFGSHQSGHLCLLRLKEQMYPGGESKDHWPTLCLNTLRWAKKQGALCGPAHSGWGLQVKGSELRLSKRDRVHVTARVAAMLPEIPLFDATSLKVDEKPYWDIERARISSSRSVPVELLVNGLAVQRQEMLADGKMRDVSFDVP